MNLFTDIPESTSTSFFRGTPCVTLKERVFEPSLPIRHYTELYNQICASNDKVEELCKEILVLVTDGETITLPTPQPKSL